MGKKSKQAWLGPTKPYVDLIDEVIEKRQSAAESRFPLSPSQAGQCSRKLAYDLADYLGLGEYPRGPIAPHVARLFKLGHTIERHSMDYFYGLKEVVPGTEVKYVQAPLIICALPAVGKQPARLVEGSNDLAVRVGPEGSLGIGDVKSKKDKFAQGFKSDWDKTEEDLDGMKTLVRIPSSREGSAAWWADDLPAFLKELGDFFFEQNFVQLNTYGCSEFMQRVGVDHGFIYRYNKNDSRHMEVRFRLAPRLAKKVCEKFQDVWVTTIKHGPEKVKQDHVLGSIACAFCDHKERCWGDQDALRAFFRENYPRTEFPKDLTRMTAGDKVEEMITRLDKLQAVAAKAGRVEQRVAQLIVDSGERKVRTSDGRVLEVRELKNPRRLVVRRVLR